MSDNLISNMTQRFAQLSCLRFLISLDLSNNRISTALRASDFDDSFGELLRTFNLRNNQIPSLESGVFFKDKENREPRFPYLAHLCLANNRIKSLDLLWPMILPNPKLKIDLSNNPIMKLTNELGLSYNEPNLIEISGDRYVDLRNNSLEFLDDSNLMQYGLKTQDDFGIFLIKLKNFDFRQNKNKFECFCPNNSGSYLVHWYRNFSKQMEHLEGPIFDLYCSNMNQSYIFDFNCTVSKNFIYNFGLSLLFIQRTKFQN
jgi:hypothetical protein